MPEASTLIPIRYSDWGWFEHLAALRSIGRTADSSMRLRRAVGGARCVDDVLPLGSGRSALMLALDAMGRARPARRVVVVPSYVCPSVVAVVGRLGLEPRLAPVSRDLNLDVGRLADTLDDTVLAVVAVHMYGYPLDIAAVERVAIDRGVFVIDDAAHCLPVRGPGPSAGFGGSAGIFSFALSKAVSNGCSGRGGVLTINDPALRATLRGAWTNLPEGASSRWDDLLFMVSCLGERAFDRLPWTVRSAFLRVVGRRCVDPWQACRISGRDAELALSQIEGADAARRRRAARIQAILDAVPDTDACWFPHRLQAGRLTRLVVCLRDAVTEDGMRRFAREAGMTIRMGYGKPGAGSLPFGAAFEVSIGADWPAARLEQFRRCLARLANLECR